MKVSLCKYQLNLSIEFQWNITHTESISHTNKWKDQIQVLSIRGRMNLEEINDKRMRFQRSQETHFPESSLSVSSIPEGVENLLQRDFPLFIPFLFSFPYDSIRLEITQFQIIQTFQKLAIATKIMIMTMY